jgi:hypothetical protein
MIDKINADLLIVSFFPADGQFIANAIGKCFWLCKSEKVKKKHINYTAKNRTNPIIEIYQIPKSR